MRYMPVVLIGLVALLASCMDAGRDALNVTLALDEPGAVRQIVLRSSNGTDSLLQVESRTVSLRCPLEGEGTYTLCVFRKADTLCTGLQYAEGGYHPKWALKNDSLYLLRSF